MRCNARGGLVLLNERPDRMRSTLADWRMTPALLGQFCLATVWAGQIARAPINAVRPQAAT